MRPPPPDTADEVEPPPAHAIDDAAAAAILGRAIERYVVSRHGRVRRFVDANFSVAGSQR